MKLLQLFVALGLVSSAALAQVVALGELKFTGEVIEASDLSAVQKVGDYLALASDEGTVMQLLRRVDDRTFDVAESIHMLAEGAGEIDMEALAAQGNTLFVLGSHSWGRKRTRDKYSSEQNRQRLSEVALEGSRDHLFRFELDLETGRPGASAESVSLRPLLNAHPVLGLFANTPGKENGVDFEGLAVAHDRLYLGLRGPVLRGNYVPVLSMAFDDVVACSHQFDAQPDKCNLLYVNLAGRGIRSLHAVEKGFLILAGPVNDGDVSYDLYFWDGVDCVPDKGVQNCQLRRLGEVPRRPRSGPEGLAVLEDNGSSWQVLMVYDGIDGGAPVLLQATDR